MASSAKVTEVRDEQPRGVAAIQRRQEIAPRDLVPSQTRLYLVALPGTEVYIRVQYIRTLPPENPL